MLVKSAKLKIKYDYIADYICFFAPVDSTGKVIKKRQRRFE